MNVLAIVAHPDDESFFAGGTLAMHALNGDTVTVCTLSDGVGSRFRHKQKELEPSSETRARLARQDAFYQAVNCLGVRAIYSVAFHDQESDASVQIALNDFVTGLIECEDADPNLVYTHHVGDLNLDHRRVAEAVLVATRGGATVRCMTPEWPTRCVGPMFAPTMHVHFGREPLERKIRACLCYEAELRPYPHPRSEQAIREQAMEAFMEIR